MEREDKMNEVAEKKQLIPQLIFLLLLTIVLRAITFGKSHYLNPDEFAYFFAAAEIYRTLLANNFGYLQMIETYHLPLIPIQMAAVFLFNGKVDLSLGILSVEIYNLLSVPLTYILAYVLSSDRKIAFSSSVLFAFNQAFWMNADRMMLDSPCTFYLLLFLILFISAIKRKGHRYSIYSGIVLILLFLTKEYMVFLIYPVVFLMLVTEYMRGRDKFLYINFSSITQSYP